MVDIGHEETELILRETEREVRQIYLRAQSETQAKLDDYLSRFATKDAIKKQQLKEGKITQAKYRKWRKGQICIGKRWQEMVDTLTQDYVNADKLAMSIVRGHTPEAYALNHNYATFQIERDSWINTSYTLYDRQTVERLIRDNPDLLPPPGDVDIPKDKRWNKTHIKNEITQGILQGEDLRQVSKRLQKVTDMDDRAAMRNARTAMTGAQNAGRVDAYKRAKAMGIRLEQEWLATLDGRTRHSHRQMDGQHVEVGEKFSNKCRFPGDPEGPPWEVYNCRCTLVPRIAGVDQTNAPRDSRLGGMTYEEWKKEHEKPVFQAVIPGVQGQIGRATSVQQVNDIMNAQGWWRSEKVSGTIRWVEGKIEYGPDQFVSLTKADLTGCDLESAKSVASSYQRLFDKYPQLIGKLDAPDAQPVGMSKNAYAWCYIRSNGKVQVNPNHFGDWATLSRSYERDVLSGWHPKGTTAESIVIHELGHAVDGLLAREGILGGRTSSGEYRYASSSLKGTIMRRAAKLDPDIASELEIDRILKDNATVMHHVSQYAAKDAQEWFAECFAEYLTSADPRTVASEFGKELEKLLGRLT